jgi:hypothetical protein
MRRRKGEQRKTKKDWSLLLKNPHQCPTPTAIREAGEINTCYVHNIPSMTYLVLVTSLLFLHIFATRTFRLPMVSEYSFLLFI